MYRSSGRIRRCAICGREVWAGRLCGQHGKLAYMAAAIVAGKLSEFPQDDASETTNVLPTYHALQTDARWRLASGNWRVQLAVLLTGLRVRLAGAWDDGQEAA